ncbi:UNKNOWN [Stylonychia lemnae]|uniref:Uncharacterized protein n=1 Tax=Stylonychia lemnae TaxID=5949 RepID=A0A078AVD2_STYLE|nr:UNKNOWN [Stylonychia lemnae]|eukprot:CDW85237.1 UNKNOWN [Stylonychia lemnae]
MADSEYEDRLGSLQKSIAEKQTDKSGIYSTKFSKMSRYHGNSYDSQNEIVIRDQSKQKLEFWEADTVQNDRFSDLMRKSAQSKRNINNSKTEESKQQMNQITKDLLYNYNFIRRKKEDLQRDILEKKSLQKQKQVLNKSSQQ